MKKRLFQYLFYISFLFLASTCFTSCSDDEDSGNLINDAYSHDLNVGASANDLLSNLNYTTLLVEIQYATGYAPPQSAIDNLKALLEQRLNKPDGITINAMEIAAPGLSSYSISDLQLIEDKNRTAFTEGNTMAAYFFFADGGFSQDTDTTKVLGVAYRNTSMVIFQKTINDFSGGLNQPSEGLLTSSVVNHEFGHILGLVNNGTDMVSSHQDASHGAHCDNTSCLMYWQAENSTGLSDLLGMNSPPTFDTNCLADLKNNGGK